jgi:signal transduction histidine kinase
MSFIVSFRMDDPRGTHNGILILQAGKVVYANVQAAALVGLALEKLLDLSEKEWIELIPAPQRSAVVRNCQVARDGEPDLPLISLELCDLSGRYNDLSLMVSPLLYHQAPAVQIALIDNGPRQTVEGSLRQHVQRLQILHDIEHVILSSQGEQAAARAALSHISFLTPEYRASCVIRADIPGGRGQILAIDPGEAPDLEDEAGAFDLRMLPLDLAALQSGQPVETNTGDLFTRLGLASYVPPDVETAGVSALPVEKFTWLWIPLRWGTELVGILTLACAAPGSFQPENIEVAQEIGNALAVAVQQARLYQAEEQRRREAEVMRDLMAALAGAGDLKQTLEVILVNLHNLIHYDRAGLLLVDENQRFVVTERGAQEQTVKRNLDDDPLVDEMRRTQRPVVVEDAQNDPRCANWLATWPDTQSLRGWLGAPLLIHDEMIGFLSIGSLDIAAYSLAEANTMQVFAAQVADVLEKAWVNEQSQRRTEELEVLSTITFALGQAESSENTLQAIVEQITRFLDAMRGSFLLPDRTGSTLTIKVSLDESAIGMVHPGSESHSAADPLWQAFHERQATLVPDCQELLRSQAGPVIQTLFGGAQAALIIPLRSFASIGREEHSPFGLLCFAFDQRGQVSSKNVHLYNAVAEIAGASLRRAVVLEALEKQVSLRTAHLSTLYDINAVASQPLELRFILEQVLQITLESMNSSIGAIHFLDEKGNELFLEAQQNLPPDLLVDFEVLPARADFWRNMIQSSNPVVIPDLTIDPSIPPQAGKIGLLGNPAYLCAPIRTKGQVLGLLSMFGETIQDYTLDDITLFMTIADQIGSSIERSKLMKQAELAAVVQERQRLARELHDSVTQLLYSQVLFSGAGLKVLSQQGYAQAEQYLARIDQAARQALKEMRLLVYQLRPSDYLDEGLDGALRHRLDSVEKRTGVEARLIVESEPDLEEAEQMGLYRIAEEALNNTLKHAQASNVSVRVYTRNRRVFLEVMDDGKGFNLRDREKSGGMGLTNMRERAAAMSAELQIITAPGQGTGIIVSVEAKK